MKTSMKRIFRNILLIAPAALILGSCDFLEPYPNGSYNEENYKDYPKFIRGFVDRAYNLRPGTYYATEFIGTDAGSDDAIYRSETNSMRLFSTGTAQMGSNPFSSVWTRDYKAIYYCNLFLENNLGLNTHYLIDKESDDALKISLQGDAYALRAWYHYDLLKTFGGVGLDGKLYGIPVHTKPIKSSEIDNNDVVRASFDDTAKQILEDCDSALAYIPLNNRDYPGDKVYLTPVVGSVRWKLMDQISVYGLKAMTYLLWASPAFCQDSEAAKERYEQAAIYAAKVINHKLTKEATLGYEPTGKMEWGNGNTKDLIYVSNVNASGFMAHFYPKQFMGSADITPTQNLVDAFPMANGYPISDTRSGYDKTKPYEGRDPRFYATIFYDGAEAKSSAGATMYTFDCAGQDAPGNEGTSRSSYYIKKFINPDWNPFATTVVAGYEFIAFERFEQMCLIFAEAASQAKGATTQIGGYTAKQALAFVRSKITCDNKPGIGADGVDPYLDECAADSKKFLELVKNEWRITTCFEGIRYYNLRRWTANTDDLSAVNVKVKGALVSGEAGSRSYNLDNDLETKAYPSLWNPIPYTNVRKCPNLVQNKGWESWK